MYLPWNLYTQWLWRLFFLSRNVSVQIKEKYVFNLFFHARLDWTCISRHVYVINKWFLKRQSHDFWKVPVQFWLIFFPFFLSFWFNFVIGKRGVIPSFPRKCIISTQLYEKTLTAIAALKGCVQFGKMLWYNINLIDKWQLLRKVPFCTWCFTGYV